MKLAALALVAGCFPAMTNAPGVADLSKPQRLGETYLEPTDPGTEGVALWVVPLINGGLEHNRAGLEMGGELRVERFSLEPGNTDMLRPTANGIAAGVTAVAPKDIPAIGMRAFAEVFHRTTVADAMPLVVGAGAAFDEDKMPGIQLSTHFMLMVLRARAMASGRFDITFGWELPLVFLFGHSK